VATDPARIAPVAGPGDLAAARTLFEAYAASIGIDLGYQGFAAELAGLPGKYAPPAGALLLARDTRSAAIGCVALRPLDRDACEMKRLYVAPAGRGLGLGRALGEAVLAEAARIGYREIRLDTLPTMAAAIGLYRRLGFREVAPYYDTPVAGTLFFARPL
jgi:ribosomal protein S18 acetylase RimI-like enzyme